VVREQIFEDAICVSTLYEIDVEPKKIVAEYTGFLGADLANLVNEASLFAARY